MSCVVLKKSQKHTQRQFDISVLALGKLFVHSVHLVFLYAYLWKAARNSSPFRPWTFEGAYQPQTYWSMQ